MLTGALFGLFVVLIMRITARVFAYARGYKRVSSAPAVVIFDASNEKHHLMVVSEEKSLPMYEQ
jgi:hypothetical protein